MSDTKQDDIVIQPKSVKINLTPYAQAIFVRDLNHAINSIDTSGRFSAAKYFLVCLSIELSLKSILLANGVKGDALRDIGHNLGRLSKLFSKSDDKKALEDKELRILDKATLFYNRDGVYSKGIVYFEGNMKEQALKGYKDLPEIDSIMNIKNKLQDLLEGNDYYIRL